MSILTDITVPRRGSRRRLVVLDGEPWRELPSDVVKAARLKTGMQIDVPTLESRVADDEPVCARDRAIRLLAYRERSTGEMETRLAEDGYRTDVIQTVIGDLRRLGLVDDERFARMTVRNMTEIRGLGSTRTLRQLLSKGIDPELARETLEDLLPAEAEQEAAAGLARGFACRSGATVERVAARLVRKGYRPAVALRAAKEAIGAGSRDDSEGGSDFEDGPFEPDFRGHRR